MIAVKAVGRMIKAKIDPIVQFNRWFARAQRAEPLAEAMALATANSRGHPMVRFVLLKQANPRGFVFFTDRRSRKGQALSRNRFASLAFHWDSIGRQICIAGPVERLTAEEADAYWITRPRDSQLSARTSRQSAPLKSRKDLLARLAAVRASLRGGPIARPSYWIGYRVRPHMIEFWTRRPNRLHHRELFTRGRQGWQHNLLQP